MIRRALRLGLAVGLALLFSGLPHVVSAASGECCDEQCEGSLAGNDCPPSCSLGACAKVRPAVESAVGTAGDAPAAPAVRCGEVELWPVLPLVTCGVFHPPRS